MPWFHLFRPAVKITEQKKWKKYLKTETQKNQMKKNEKSMHFFHTGKDKNTI